VTCSRARHASASAGFYSRSRARDLLTLAQKLFGEVRVQDHLERAEVGDPMSVAGAVRNEIREMDEGLPVANVRPMTDVVAAALATPRLTGFLLGSFAAIALAFAAVGIYGVGPTDPITFVAVAAALLLIALMASLLPVWRAISVSPTIALRAP
jgi:hypothetical protein